MRNIFKNSDGTPYSIKQRLLWGAGISLALFFSLTGLALDRAFQKSLISAEHSNLQGQIYLLLAAAEINVDAQGELTAWLPETLHEPRFNQIQSGLYGFIVSDKKDALLWQSESAELSQIDSNTYRPPNTSAAETFAPGTTFTTHDSYFHFHQNVFWDSPQGAKPIRFIITHSTERYQRELHAYRDQLWLWLGLAAFGLIIIQLSLLHWGLRPLRSLADALKAMESGDSINVDGEFPSETRPLVDNLNLLLEREFQQRQRYRDGLGNLAHSLKTPLAVMHSQLPHINSEGIREQLQEQITRMDEVVRRQLQRAVLRHSDSRELTPIKATCERLCKALDKVYRDKNIHFEFEIDAELCFRGDSADLMEILGNLLENACKFSQERITVSALTQHNLGKNWALIAISDDGCGIAEASQSAILQRGQRADSVNPGQGIGLSVAAEIVGDYGGQLTIDKSTLGGARIALTLPS